MEDSADVGIKTVAAAEVVGIFFGPISGGVLQIAGHVKVLEAFLGTVGALNVFVVVLVVRLDIRYEEEERFGVVKGSEIINGPVGLGIDAVATLWKEAFLAVGVEHVAIVTVRGKLQNIRGEPEIVIASPEFRGDGLVVWGVDADQIWIGGQVPLSEVADLVAGGAKPVGDGFFIWSYGDGVFEAAGLSGVFSGLQSGACRTAYGLAGEGVFKSDALGSHAVEVGRDRQRLAVTPEAVPALLIAEDKENIGFLAVHSLPATPTVHVSKQTETVVQVS